MACLLYFLINEGFNIPILDRKNDSIGNSNTRPEARISERIKLMYSSAAILFSIIEEPKLAKNPKAAGRIRK